MTFGAFPAGLFGSAVEDSAKTAASTPAPERAKIVVRFMGVLGGEWVRRRNMNPPEEGELREFARELQDRNARWIKGL
ncbi:MAG: hypothetical protein K8T20_05540 [Planctomycetes bacterium]|nr:hypothetical protein [Planctomycetota bacterium]